MDEFPFKLVLSAIALMVISCSSMYNVEEGTVGVLTRTGAFNDIVDPGFHMKVPFIDGVKIINVRSQTISWHSPEKQGDSDSRLETYSKDQQPARIALSIAWGVPKDRTTATSVFKKYYDDDGVRTQVIIPKATEAVKNVFGQYDAVTVIQNRAKFNADVALEFDRLLQGYPVTIGAVQIQDISFSDSYEKSVEERMQAQVKVQRKEQEKQQAQLDADMQVIEAEAAAKRVRLAGEAEAAAIRARSEALQSSPKLVELTLAEKWNGQLPTTMVPGQSVPFISVK